MLTNQDQKVGARSPAFAVYYDSQELWPAESL